MVLTFDPYRWWFPMAQKQKPAAPRAALPSMDDARRAELEAERLADAVAALVDEAPTLEELVGTPSFLDVLEELPQRLRDARGFRFKVYVTDRGPSAYLPDSDWGSTPPTERAIAERYGPGSYRVTCQARRKKQGGGNLPDVAIRIAAPRDPSSPAPAPVGSDSRAWDLVERLVDERAERAERLETAGDVAPPWAAQLAADLAAGRKPAEGSIPEWAVPFVEKLAEKLFTDPPAPATPAS